MTAVRNPAHPAPLLSPTHSAADPAGISASRADTATCTDVGCAAPAHWAPIAAPTTVPAHVTTAIDMLDGKAAMARLGLAEDRLLELVNAGSLAAYRFDREVRFRRRDVEAFAALAVVA